MRDVAAVIAPDARENLDGVDVVSVGPLLAEPVPGGVQYSAVVIVAERGGKDFVPSFVMLDVAQDPFMAHVYRTGLIIALEEFWSRADFRQRADALQILPKRLAKRARKSSCGRDGAQSRAKLRPLRP